MPNLPLADSFKLHRELYSLTGEADRGLLEKLSRHLDLKQLMCRPPREFSQGQRARAELGLLLYHSPQLVFLDEITAALDLDYLPNFLDLLKETGAHGAAIFLISHRKDDLACADRLLTIEAVRISRDVRS